MKKQKAIAIIPARSGSKRIPQKNIKELSGRPMIAWTIEAALASKLFADVLVSTDCQAIADISKSCGAQVPFLRNEAVSDDFTPVAEATLAALLQMEEYKQTKYDVVVQLMPNCPCRDASDIIAAFNNFTQQRIDSQISAFQYGWMNPWWAMMLDEISGMPKPLFPKKLKKRSQDLNELYCPSGAVWITKTDKLKNKRTFYGSSYQLFLLDWDKAIDIDEMVDFKMAEMILFVRKEKPGFFE